MPLSNRKQPEEKQPNLWQQFWSNNILVRTIFVLCLMITIPLSIPVAVKIISCLIFATPIFISFLRKDTPTLINWFYNGLKRHIVQIAVFALVILFCSTSYFVCQHFESAYNIALDVKKAVLVTPESTTGKMEYVKGIFTLVAGLVGILALTKSFFALDLDREKAQLEETKAQNERFAKAIEHLGNDAIDIRLGGIFALEALMNENPERFASRVITQLCAYSSNRGWQLNALWQTHKEDEQEFFKALKPTEKPPSLPPFADLQEAARIVCKTPHWKDYHKKPLQLNNVFWRGFHLQNSCNLAEANLQFTFMEKVDLSGAETNLSGANLYEANLGYANLSDAKLKKTDWGNSKLHKTNFEKSDLSGSKFYDPSESGKLSNFKSKKEMYLNGTDFRQANLSGVEFYDVCLTEVNFSESDLRRAIFQRCDASYCVFYGCKISNLDKQNLLKLPSVLKHWKQCIPGDEDAARTMKNEVITFPEFWEQNPKDLTDKEVEDRLKLVVDDDDAPIPPPAVDPVA